MSELLNTEKLSIGYAMKNNMVKPLLPPVDLRLNQGDFVALMGPNGAGKTTLLRTLSGMIQPLGGKIRLDGKQVQTFSPGEKARLISLVLTDKVDDFFLKVYDVVAMGRYPYLGFWGKLSTHDHAKVTESLMQTSCAQLSGRNMGSLSDGERQRVMIAKALAQDTPMIFLDEPAAFLDYPGKIELMQLLQNLSRIHRKTILFSSHDLDLAMGHADRIWLMGIDRPLADDIPENHVLKGNMGKYFNREGLHYEPETGKFVLTAKKGKAVRLMGSGPQAMWMHHALQRKGYQIVDDEHTSLAVLSSAKGFTLQVQNKDITFSPKIETILYELSKIDHELAFKRHADDTCRKPD